MLPTPDTEVSRKIGKAMESLDSFSKSLLLVFFFFFDFENFKPTGKLRERSLPVFVSFGSSHWPLSLPLFLLISGK